MHYDDDDRLSGNERAFLCAYEKVLDLAPKERADSQVKSLADVLLAEVLHDAGDHKVVREYLQRMKRDAADRWEPRPSERPESAFWAA